MAPGRRCRGNRPSRSTAPYGKDYEANSLLLQERERACANQEVAWSRGQGLLLGRRKEIGRSCAVFAPACLEETDAGCKEQEEAGMALPRWSRDLCFVPLLAEHRSCF